MWATHGRNLFVLTSAGKPVWSLWGTETEQSGITSVLQAIISNSTDQGDTICSCTAGDVLMVFTTRGPLHLVATSSKGDSEHALQQVLRLVHNGLLFAVTSKLHQRLYDRPGADVRPLLIGTDPTLRTVARLNNRSPCIWMDAYPMLALPAAVRSKIVTFLTSAATAATAASAATGSGGSGGTILYAILLAGWSVVAWAQPRAREHALRPADVTTLACFLHSAGTLRSSDAWTPVCMPGLSDSAFVHALISCVGTGYSRNVRVDKSGGGGGGGGWRSVSNTPQGSPLAQPPATAAAATGTGTGSGSGIDTVPSSLSSSGSLTSLLAAAASTTPASSPLPSSASATATATAAAAVAASSSINGGSSSTPAAAVSASTPTGAVSTPPPPPPAVSLTRQLSVASATAATMSSLLSRPRLKVSSPLALSSPQPYHSYAAATAGSASASAAAAAASSSLGGVNDGSPLPAFSFASPTSNSGSGGSGGGAGGDGDGAAAAAAAEAEAEALPEVQLSAEEQAVSERDSGSASASASASAVTASAGEDEDARPPLQVGDGDGESPVPHTPLPRRTAAAAAAADTADTAPDDAAAATPAAPSAVAAAEAATPAPSASPAAAAAAAVAAEADAGAAIPTSADNSSSTPGGPVTPLIPVPLPLPPPSPWNPPPPYHPDADTSPPVFLVFISTGSSEGHIDAVAAAKTQVARSLLESGTLAAITSAMTAAGHTGTSDVPAVAYSIPGLVHFIYMWKPTRQYSATTWPWPASCATFQPRRAALMRAYCAVYEQVTAATPVLRHAVSAWEGGGFDLTGQEEGAAEGSSSSSSTSRSGGGGSKAGSGPSSTRGPYPLAHIQAIAGLHTTHAILLAAFDASPSSDRIPASMERLAKMLKKDNEKLFMAAPGVL